MTDYADRQLGNYRLLRLLGHGGFADVYLGEHVHLKTLAAIKILHTQLTSNDVEKFRTEARTIASLEHPNIIRVLDFGIENYTPFLVLSYAPYGTLRQHHPKGTQLPLSTIVSYVKQVADALYYAHERKLIHRDVKPENMLLGRNNEVLLSDFGFVVIAQSSWSESTEMAGTIPYMAPEQLQGKPRPASDQYALGVVAYEWMCGERPFNGTPMEIATQHMLSSPPSLCAKNPAIPASVEEVIRVVLNKDPQQRFSSVKAFAYALEQASLDALPSGTTIPLMKPAQTPFPMLPAAPVTPVLSPLGLAETPHVSDEPTSPSAQTSADTEEEVPASNVASSPQSHPQRYHSRGWFLTGLLGGVALTSATGGGLWLAQAKGFLGGKPAATPSPPTPILPLPGTRLFTYRGHADWVYSVAWSPDGYRIASASKDYTVQVWDAVTGKRLYTLHADSDAVSSLAWSPDGKRIASGGFDSTVRVWNALTGEDIQVYNEHQVQVWDAFTGNNLLVYRGHSNKVWSVAWDPEGKRIASASKDQTVQVWWAA